MIHCNKHFCKRRHRCSYYTFNCYNLPHPNSVSFVDMSDLETDKCSHFQEMRQLFDAKNIVPHPVHEAERAAKAKLIIPKLKEKEDE